jgi:hypothetical protein
VYFVEAGTGHVFTIDPMVEDSEMRISNITVPVATKAVVSKDGRYIAIRSGNNTESALTILTITGETVDTFSFDEPVRSFSINTDNDVLYTVAGGLGLYGRVLEMETKTTKTLFEIPFREAAVVWGAGPDDTHYVFPKSSHYLEGYLYEIVAGEFSRTSASGFGLMATGNSQTALYTKLQRGDFASFLLDRKSGVAQNLAFNFVPEKCSFGVRALYCAVSTDTSQNHSFPDNWYRGEISFSDDIWEISTDSLWMGTVVETLAESGRELDIINMSIGTNDALLYFNNKNDQSLWTYEFPIDPNSTE